MADAHEAARHDVQQKASQEFGGIERHDPHAAVVRVVLPVEPNTVVNEPMIRQGDAVGVPTEVGEHLVGAGEGPLRIDDPRDRPQLTRCRTLLRQPRSAQPLDRLREDRLGLLVPQDSAG